MSKFEIWNTTSGKVKTGVRLCYDNALRTVRDATILLDHGGSAGNAYVLWTFAVEEFGKGLLLDAQVAKGAPEGQAVEVRLSKDHEEKLAAGFNHMPELVGRRIGTFLQVTTNTGGETVVLKDPMPPRDSLSVGGFATGQFSDGSDQAGVDSTKESRFSMLYVKRDGTGPDFLHPSATIRRNRVEAKWELDQVDLREAIDALSKHVTTEIERGS